MNRTRFLIALISGLTGLLAAPMAAAQPAENLLFITYDGLRGQELFGGADARLMTEEAGAKGHKPALREKFMRDTPEARRETLLPFFWNEIAVKGQVYGHAESGSPGVVENGKYFSYPGYNEILTGAPDDRVDSNAKKHNENVTVLEWLDGRPGFKGRVAAFGSWDVFPYIINTERSGLPVNAGWTPLTVSPDPDHLRFLNEISAETPHYWDNVRFDLLTFHGAVEYIKAEKPRVLYVAFGETDDWAHDRRYDMYLDSARRTDDYIRRLWELMQSMPQYQGKTAMILTTDHGRGDTKDDWTGHGTDIAGADRIWMALYGAGVPAKGIVKDTSTTLGQAAATAAALIGQDFRADHPEAAPPITP